MNVIKVLVTAAAFALSSMSAAFAADAIISVDGLKSVEDSKLSEMHGKNITVNNNFTNNVTNTVNNNISASSTQSLDQENVNSPVLTFGGGMANGPVSIDAGNFAGLGNVIGNSGNGNNLGQQMSVVLILH